MKAFSIISFVFILLNASCTEDSTLTNTNGSNNAGEWLIPRDQVRDGGPGKDGIPALTEPELSTIDETNWLSGEDLVIGFADDDDIRAYPHAILDWHEIINDKTENHSIAIIYCPLTGTGIGWNRITDNNSATTFGVSGLLYNSNIIPYDRATDSNWSQMLFKSVNGTLAGQKADNYNLVETTWETWKEMYPMSKVVSKNTGYSRSYGAYPYGGYRENESLIFPVSNNDNRLHAKERVLSVFQDDEKARAYTFDDLAAHNNLIIDNFQGKEIIVTGSKQDSLMVAFQTQTQDGTQLEFQVIQNKLPELLRDNEGSTWDVFGRAVSGPREGEHLQTITFMMGYWFSFAAFYPEIELFGTGM